MRILNIGSLNLDHVYRVQRFVQPGETMAVREVTVGVGGKGLNQSIALARAGAAVSHGGLVGAGGELLRQTLEENGVDLQRLEETDVPQGHAIIQVSDEGENCILLYGGSNRALTAAQIGRAMDGFTRGDWLLLQNETNLTREIVEEACARGLQVAFNPSPFDKAVLTVDFDHVAWLLVNEVEAQQMTGSDDPFEAWDILHGRYPDLCAVITLGGAGAICFTPEGDVRQPAYPARAVDTTGAGDTFTGYFLASLLENRPLSECMQRAAMAASICVTRPGAAAAIPTLRETEAALRRVE